MTQPKDLSTAFSSVDSREQCARDYGAPSQSAVLCGVNAVPTRPLSLFTRTLHA